MAILSPITHQPAEFLKSIPCSLIIESYKKDIGLDVSAYFDKIDAVQVYKCVQTGYRFYFPFDLAGDDKFYEFLQKYDWYYSPWKWDYDAALPFINKDDKVLDIGCGYGNFLVRIKETKNCDCTGLEFNDAAVDTGTKRGLRVIKEYVQDHAKNNAEKYDVVCFFQVLEHIADIDSFMTAAIACLKPGGRLIVCVPNNNPYFYKYEEYHSLNMPPHHMGLWNREAFSKLANVYPIKVEKICEETLTRFRYYLSHYIADKAQGSKLKQGLLYLVSPFLMANFLLQRKKIVVGNILVSYKKN